MKPATVILQIIATISLSQLGFAEGKLPEPDVKPIDWSTAYGTIEELEAELDQGFVAPDIKQWVKEFDHVDIIIYDRRKDLDKPLILAGKFNEKFGKLLAKRLDSKEVQLLTQSISGKHKPMWQFMCFDPYHAFVFYDMDSKILGHIEICFGCRTFRSYPKNGLSEYWDLNSIKKLILLKDLPVFDASEEWNKYFSKLTDLPILQESREAESGPRD